MQYQCSLFTLLFRLIDFRLNALLLSYSCQVLFFLVLLLVFLPYLFQLLRPRFQLELLQSQQDQSLEANLLTRHHLA
ncbi:conserved membrane protein of unknown function [Listeria monocytogenes]|nr:conserved membrane protein of unknown function [Listeria monocytogenes]